LAVVVAANASKASVYFMVNREVWKWAQKLGPVFESPIRGLEMRANKRKEKKRSEGLLLYQTVTILRAQKTERRRLPKAGRRRLVVIPA